MKKIAILLFATASIGIVSCEKMLDYPPQGVILAEDALKTPEDAQRLLNSCYDVMANVFDGSYQNLAELMSDNLGTPTGNDYNAVYNRSTNFFTPTTNGVYADFYYAIYRCNTLLANFDLIENLSETERARMEAEARFIRGLCHWHVAKLWAQPYGYSAGNSHLGIVIRNEASNEPKARSTVGETYDFIIADLNYARENLPETNDVYATKNAASAALALVYFQMNNYTATVQFANEVINSGMYPLNDTIDRFPTMVSDGVNTAVMNPETIFGTVSFSIDQRTDDLIGSYNSSGVVAPALTLSQDFYNLLNQNASDERTVWAVQDGSQYLCTRFQDKSIFNVPIIHLTELKLIRAEALAELGQDLSVAIQDINDVRVRAFGSGVNEVPDNTGAADIITFARNEYRKETVCEGKWVDQLKRRGAKGENIVIRNAPWSCDGMALQFPNAEFTSAVFVGNPEGGCN